MGAHDCERLYRRLGGRQHSYMTLGSEFTFHKSIDRPAQKGSGMRLFQLNHSGEWVTQNAVTDKVAEAIRKLMESRGRESKHWRLLDPNHVAPVKRAAQPRKRPQSNAETGDKPTPKPRTSRAKKAALSAVESTGKATE